MYDLDDSFAEVVPEFNISDADDIFHAVVAGQVDETIRSAGTKSFYISKENIKPDMFFGDWKNSIFGEAKEIKLKHPSIKHFGEGDMFTKFGNYISDDLTFFGTLRQFSEISTIPKRGDLIYVPYMKHRIWEVARANDETDNLIHGFDTGAVAYELKCKIYKPQTFSKKETGIVKVDKLNELNQKEIDSNNKRYDQVQTDNNLIIDNNDPLMW